MTAKQFSYFRKNRNFTISQNRIHTVANHIAEGETSAYTKNEAAQTVTYFALSHEYAQNEIANLKLEITVMKFKTAIKDLRP